MKKAALITGASSGIGRELARIHAKNGGDLVVVARDRENLEKLRRELGNKHSTKVMVIEKDLCPPQAAEEVFREVKERGIEIEFLINNAGFGGVGKFHERDWEKDLAMIQLNVVALTELTRLFLPEMIERGKGKILNVSSTASLMSGPLQAVYYATKAYVTSFSNAISEELSDTNVTVSNLMPGATETKFGKVSGMDKTEIFKHTASAKRVAGDGYKGMMNGKLNIISGVPLPLRLMMLTLPFIPKKLMLKQVKKMQEIKD